MDELLQQIARIKESEVGDVLSAVLGRYGVLFPDWEVGTVSVNKCEDRNEQIDRIIEMLERMKRVS